MALRTVGVRLTAEISAYQANLRAAGTTTKGFVGELDKASKSGHLEKVANSAGIAGLALTGMAAYAIKSAADFDKSMSAVSAATHASTSDLGLLRAAALQAGKDTQYSATQAADGITELSKAGIGTADVLNGGLKGALSLAAAGQISVADAAQTAASAMTQFGLKGDKIPHLADLLAAAAGKAQGSVGDMSYALSQGGLVAAQMGLSIEDTTGTLAAFASAGLLGSDAGTSFKTMMLALQNPVGKTADLMKQLGISAYDTQGKFVGIANFAGILQSKLSTLTPQMRQQALAQIFGNDAVRAGTILYTQGAAGIQSWINKVNDAGYASTTAAKLTDNLAGDIERLKGSVETLAISSGSGASGGLRILTKGLNDLVNGFLDLPPAVGSSLTVLTGISGVLLLGMVAWLKYRKVMADVQAQLAATGPAGEKAAVGLGKVTSALGKIGMWTAAAEAATLLFNSLDQKSVDVDKLTASLQNLATTGKSAGELNKDFGNNFDKLGRIAGFAESANHGFGSFVDKVASATWVFGDAGKAIGDFGSRLITGTDFDTAKQQMASLDTALTSFMTTTNDAKKSSDLWNQVLSQSGLDTQQLAELLPNTYKEVGALNTAADQSKGAVGGLAGAAQKAAGATGDLSSATTTGAAAQKTWANEADAAAGAARGEIGALTDLNNRMKAQVNPVFGLIDAEDGLAKAHQAATDAVKKHGKGSLEAQDADRKLALAAITLQGAAGALGTTFNGKMTPALYQTLRAAGLTEAQIKDVAGQFRQAKKDADKYQGNYAANVSAPGAANAINQIRTLKQELASMRTRWNVTIRQNFLTFGKPYSQAGVASGNIGGLAGGGPVIGAGPKGVDSEPRLLAPGEHVWSAAEVDAVGGQAAMAKMRAAALTGSTHRGDAGSTRVMPAVPVQRVIVETRNVVEFAGGADAFGQLMLNTLRVKPGVRKTMAKTLLGA
jgi:TP901 family phage tail tape measure protein